MTNDNGNIFRSWNTFKGLSYREISEKTGVNIAIISKILHDMNGEARGEIKGWLNDLMPIEYKKSCY